MVFWLLFSNESIQNILILSATVAPFASAGIRPVVNRLNQDTTVYYGLVFCLFSWPYMVKWHNSGIIILYIKYSKHELPFVCLCREVWNPQPIKHNVHYFALCKPVLQKLYCFHQHFTTEEQVCIQLTLAVPGSPPRLDLINLGLWYYNRNAYYRRKVALFSPCRGQERRNNLFWKA